MAQVVNSASEKSEVRNPKSPASIPLPSSKGSSIVSAPPPTSPHDSPPNTEDELTTGSRQPDALIASDRPVVAINFPGTLPSSNFSPPLAISAPPSRLKSSSDLHEASRKDTVFEKSALVGLGLGSDLGIGNGNDIERSSGSQSRNVGDESDEDGSDLGLANVSPITYHASPMASPTEEKFAMATLHLRRDSAARRERGDVESKRIGREKEEQRTFVVEKERERESSEEIMIVPDLRPNVESAAEQRRRRRRLERRQSAASTPVVSPEPEQRAWAKKG